MSAWVTVNAASRRLRSSRWGILLRCLRKELQFRETATGVELTEASVAKAEAELPPKKGRTKKVATK